MQIKEPKIALKERNNFHMLKYFFTRIETERAKKNSLDQIINYQPDECVQQPIQN